MANAHNLSRAERSDSAIQRILERREKAREEGDYELADRIREGLARFNIEVRDTRNGPRWTVRI